jgi:hypothetical protein
MDRHTFTMIWIVVWFTGTVALVAWSLYRLRFKPTWWWAAFFGMLVLSCILMGLRRGPLAWLVGNFIAWIFSSARFQNWRDCRRAGKKIAVEIGIKPSLFFTAIELAFRQMGQAGGDVMFFAGLYRSPSYPKDEIYRLIMPGLVIGFNALDARFGKQAGTEAAKVKIKSLVRQYCNDPPDWARD